MTWSKAQSSVRARVFRGCASCGGCEKGSSRLAADALARLPKAKSMLVTALSLFLSGKEGLYARMLTSFREGALVAACGLAASFALLTTGAATPFPSVLLGAGLALRVRIVQHLREKASELHRRLLLICAGDEAVLLSRLQHRAALGAEPPQPIAGLEVLPELRERGGVVPVD
eukprot:CAMPEP_0171278962 /NCGR_PEP_ID=MMETSP0790-20130122/65140_1 /TAXON_ID=2925 /ORGANISM="Alexandrium catenella, Strain OF101" /LENGTH=172 /DNA_ID=CAMNT_0011748137 /DNA_START=37 /DNA_END=554 /DNA_ORIENTATION=+